MWVEYSDKYRHHCGWSILTNTAITVGGVFLQIPSSLCLLSHYEAENTEKIQPPLFYLP